MFENKSEGKQHVNMERKLAERDGVACQRRGERKISRVNN